MSSPKFIFFDIGNVFMTFDKVFTRVCHDFQIDQSKLDELYEPYDINANLGKIDIPDIWPILCQKLNINNGQNYNFVESWVSDYEAISPMHELVNSIRDKYQLGIISNYYRGYFEEAIRQQFIPAVNFYPVIISAEVGCMKPERQIYDIAESRSGFSGSDILFIDDKPENLVVPTTLGWRTFLFDYKHPEASTKELSSLLKI